MSDNLFIFDEYGTILKGIKDKWKSRARLTPEGKAKLTPENFFILTPANSWPTGSFLFCPVTSWHSFFGRFHP